jgi:hypothetical protein
MEPDCLSSYPPPVPVRRQSTLYFIRQTYTDTEGWTGLSDYSGVATAPRQDLEVNVTFAL